MRRVIYTRGNGKGSEINASYLAINVRAGNSYRSKRDITQVESIKSRAGLIKLLQIGVH